MMTLKLVASHRTYLAEAEAVTIYAYNHRQVQVTAHLGGHGQAFYVGDEPPSGEDQGDGPPGGEMWYDEAYVENRFGQTVERIRPVLAPRPRPGRIDISGGHGPSPLPSVTAQRAS